jgi:hypothetical protein
VRVLYSSTEGGADVQNCHVAVSEKLQLVKQRVCTAAVLFLLTMRKISVGLHIGTG